MCLGPEQLCPPWPGVLALAIGTVLRRSATAVATVIVVIFIPYLLAIVPNGLP